MTEPVNKLLDSAMSCTRCGTKGMFNCSCYERCTCGWIADKGKPCRNPETKSCSTKVKYGKYNRKTKRWE